MRSLIRSVFSLLSPPTCSICEEKVSLKEVPICSGCWKRLERTHFEKTPQQNPLYAFFHPLYGIRSAWALFYFDKKGLLQKAIHSLKYRGRKDVGIWFGNYLGKILSKHPFYQDLSLELVPVPLHWRRKQERGYNQSEIIAKGIASRTGYPIQSRLLKRVRHTPSQTQLNRNQRLLNVKGAIMLTKKTVQTDIILIDDLMTTGSTLMACLDALGPFSERTHIITLAIPRDF